MKYKDNYDVIVIGAGISGLVCGCYLAKAGLKTLIVERNHNVGGYCSSFRSNGLRFDAFVHSLGSCRKSGIITSLLAELNLGDKIKLKRSDPSDIIVTPDYRISFWSDSNKTISELQKSFPKEERNIKRFFSDLDALNGALLAQHRNKTFKDLLCKYFNDERLMAILSFPILGNMGLAASSVSAFSAVKLCTEFLLDGGYYLEDGVQILPDMLAIKFKEYGGDLLLSTLAEKIKIKNKKAEGVALKHDNFITSKYVVSSIDATQTFFQLLKEGVSKEFLTRLSALEPSLSMFILYLGLKEGFKELPTEGSNTWYLPNYDVEKMYISAKKRNIDNLAEFMVHVFSKTSMSVFINAHFGDKEYWDKCKKSFSEGIIKKLEGVMPGLSNYTVYKQIATPHVLYRSTLNYKGAAYGWASMPSQFAESGLSQVTDIKNLYLTGHWTTLAQGVGGVAYLGRDTANMIIMRNENI